MIAQAASATPAGYDVVVDVIAGPMVGPGLKLLRPGGRWVVAGALGGWAVDLDVRRLYLANLALGSTMHTPRTQRQLAQRQHVGKLVVVP